MHARPFLAAGLAAAAAVAVFPLAAPAAADPGPLSLVTDGCTITGSGTGYERLSLSIQVAGTMIDQELAASTTSTVSAEYGLWMVAEGDTATITLDASNAGSAAGTESTTIGSCATGTELVFDETTLGTPPAGLADDDGHPLEDAIEALAAAGIVVGKAPGAFDPDATVTREQIATMLVALVDRLTADGAW